MIESQPGNAIDQLSQQEVTIFSIASDSFFLTWQNGVAIAGPQWFGDGTRAGMERATSKWDLSPNLARIKKSYGVLSSGERLFLAALVSFYNAREGSTLLKRCGYRGLADLNGLDFERRMVVAQLMIHYAGW